MTIWRVLFFSFTHFALSVGAGFVGYGADLDQISSRSGVARYAAAVHGVLQFPHDVLIRSLPQSWLEFITPGLGILFALHSLAWGLGLVALTQLIRTRLGPTKISDLPAIKELP